MSIAALNLVNVWGGATSGFAPYVSAWATMPDILLLDPYTVSQGASSRGTLQLVTRGSELGAAGQDAEEQSLRQYQTALNYVHVARLHEKRLLESLALDPAAIDYFHMGHPYEDFFQRSGFISHFGQERTPQVARELTLLHRNLTDAETGLSDWAHYHEIYPDAYSGLSMQEETIALTSLRGYLINTSIQARNHFGPDGADGLHGLALYFGETPRRQSGIVLKPDAVPTPADKPETAG